jgi:hypothetical protein
VVDELEQVLAVDGGVAEAFSFPEPVRVQAAAADIHHRAGPALSAKRVRPDLPGYRCRVVKRAVEAAGRDVQAHVGGTGIGGAERVELLDRAVGVDHHQRAWQQPESLHLAGLAEYELDQLAEQADPCLLPRRGVPALEHADQPVSVPVARRGAAPVGVRQQQVNRRRGELQQRLVRAHRVVLDVDRAQDAAVAVTELWRPQQVEAVGDRVEAVAAIGVAPVPAGRLGVPVQADAYPDPQALQRGEHRTVKEGAVGLEAHVHLGGHVGPERTDQAGQPLRSREQRLAAVQDDVDAREAVLAGVLGDALDGLDGYGGAHPLGQPPPALVGHLIDVAV